MTELELYRFITDHNVERSKNEDTILVWIYHFLIDDFVKLCWWSTFDEWWLDIRLQEDYICLDITSICECHDIDPDNIFKSD